MGRERVFHLHAINVLTAAIDHVLLAIDDLDEAVGIDSSHVTRMQPSVDKSLRRGFGLVPITLDDVLTPDEQFADTARLIGLVKLYVHHGRCESNSLGPQFRIIVREKRRYR